MELFTINGANFDMAHSKKFIYYYSGKIILVDKHTRRTIIAYVCDEAKINETRIQLSLCTRGSQDIQLIKLQYDKSNVKYYYGLHGEYAKYNLYINSAYYDVKEYYPIRIMLSSVMKSNF